MIIPILRSFDEGKLRAFYLDYLGFLIDWEHRFGPGMPLYLQVSRGDWIIHLSEHHGDACPGAAASYRSGIPSVTGWSLPSRCRRKKTPNKKTGADGSRFFICLHYQAASCSALRAGSPLWAKRSAHRAMTPSPVTLQAVPKLSWAR